MSGSADLRFGPGKLAGEPLESMVAQATFNGPNVNIESIDVQLVAGHIVANGNFNTKTQGFDFQGKAENIQLARSDCARKQARFSVSYRCRRLHGARLRQSF